MASARLVHALHRAALIDEYQIWTFPVVLGAGKTLFPASDSRQTWRLLRSAATAQGVVMGIYRR